MCVGESLLVPYYFLGSFPYFHKRLCHIFFNIFFPNILDAIKKY
jgi:hypothetical protein